MAETQSVIDAGCLIFDGRSVDKVWSKLRTQFEGQPNQLFANVLTRVAEPEPTVPEGCSKTETDIRQSIDNLFLERDPTKNSSLIIGIEY